MFPVKPKSLHAGGGVKQSINRVTTFLILVLSASLTFAAGKSTSRQVVDSGTFGVYVGGRRVASESFRVEQGSTMSMAHSELRDRKSVV